MRGGSATLAVRRLGGRRPLSLPDPPPRLRLVLLVVAALCVVLAAGYRFWLRDSALVAVDRVMVTGLTTEEAPRVRAALESTARTMTTLHVDRDRLEEVVEAYPVVRALEVQRDLPHELRIRVLEHHPAALAITDGGEVPVAADGTALRGLRVERRLPTIRADGVLRADHLADAAARAAARVAGAAPAPLHGRVERVDRRRSDGFVAELRDGPELLFGDAARIRAKWRAAARVLADPKAAGASYIDLRLPGRPAAGGLLAATVAPVAPADATAPIDPAAPAPTDPTAPIDPAAPAPTDPTAPPPGAPDQLPPAP